MKFYSVAKGRIPGVYTSWSECFDQVNGFSSAKYRSFPTEMEASKFLSDNSSASVLKKASTATSNVKKKQEVSSASSSSMALRKRPLVTLDDWRSRKRIKRTDGEERALTKAELFVIDRAKTDFVTERWLTDFSPFFALVAEERHLSRLNKLNSEIETRKSKNSQAVVVYTDGAASKNGKKGAAAGIGVHFGPNSPRNVSRRLQGEIQTNQRAELCAILMALYILIVQLEIRQRIVVYTDSKYCLRCITEWVVKWKQNGWTLASTGSTVMNRDLIERIDDLKRIHELEVGPDCIEIKWVRGHSKSPGNIAADFLATSALRSGDASGSDILYPFLDNDEFVMTKKGALRT